MQVLDFTRSALRPVRPNFGSLDIVKSLIEMLVMHAEMFMMYTETSGIKTAMYGCSLKCLSCKLK